MAEPEPFRSGDALFAFASDLKVVSWNAAMERLTARCVTRGSGAAAAYSSPEIQPITPKPPI